MTDYMESCQESHFCELLHIRTLKMDIFKSGFHLLAQNEKHINIIRISLTLLFGPIYKLKLEIRHFIMCFGNCKEEIL